MSRYHSNLLDSYRRRVNADKGILAVRKAVNNTCRIEEFRNKERIKQEMAKQRRLQMESDKRLKFRMQQIREQERTIANRYAHIKKPNSYKNGKMERNRFGNQTDRTHNVQINPQHELAVGHTDISSVVCLPSLDVSKVSHKSSSASVGKSSNYEGNATLHVSTKQSLDVNLSFTRSVLQEMETTNPYSQQFEQRKSYPDRNPPALSAISDPDLESLHKQDQYIDYNSIARARGQNYLVQASMEDPRWYQHIFVVPTNNGPMYFASDQYYYHPGGEKLEPVYLMDETSLQTDFNHSTNTLPGSLTYGGRTDLAGKYNSQNHRGLAHNLRYQSSVQQNFRDWNTSQVLESQYYSHVLSKKKYDMLVLNEDDQRAEQIRVKQADINNPYNTYDILSIEQANSRTPSAR